MFNPNRSSVNSLLAKFRNLRVATKIGIGFAILGLVLTSAVAITIWQVGRTATVTNRIVDLRAPTTQASLGMMNGMNHSLAALRGWMILGKDKFKEERAKAWSEEIDKSLATMRESSVNWTDSANIERLKTIESKLADFRKYQQEIEDISHTMENTPATKLLLEQAAPKASVLAENITKMIDAEAAYDTSIALEAAQGAAGAIQMAKVATQQIVTTRRYYTKNVVAKLKAEDPDAKVAVGFHDVKGAIPPPATFVRETAEALGENAGYGYELLGKWNINKGKGLSDSFEEQAWESLSKDPKTPYAEFVSVGSGVHYRYATADVASAAGCVSCHNRHEDSSKKDFKLGDLMGILVVSAPVTQDADVAKVLLSLGAEDSVKRSVTAEGTQELVDNVLKRKSMLGMMADTRGTLGLGLGSLRAYLFVWRREVQTTIRNAVGQEHQAFRRARQEHRTHDARAARGLRTVRRNAETVRAAPSSDV
jgi:CHASE3 domain sensor protein